MSDLISRHDAISAVVNTSIPYCTFGRKSREYNALKRDAVYAIKALPSEEKAHGEWVLDGGTPICSVCHKEPCWSSEGYDFTDFCPNCGAKMKGGEDE